MSEISEQENIFKQYYNKLGDVYYSKLGDVYYSKLGDVYNQPKSIDNIKVTEDINNLIEKVKLYKTNKCGPINQELSCKIDDNDIKNISKFLAHIVPKCPQTDINLEDIKNGKILSKGAFGYGFSAGNSVIKIIVCNDIKNIRYIEQIGKEINMHKVLTLLNMDIFTKLKGYFIRNNNVYDFYNYYKISNKYELLEECNFKLLDYDKLCETYLLIEKGEYDLEKVVEIVNFNDNEMTRKKEIPEKSDIIFNLKIVDKFEKLLTIYKTVFRMNGNVFVHSDIKTSNIVVISDNGDIKYKFIDFGTSFISNTFFNNAVGGSPNLFKLLIDNNFKIKKYIPYDIIVSPLYDLFCILFSIFEICIGRKPVNMIGVTDSVMIFFSKYPVDEKYIQQKQKLYRMFYLLEMIHDFYSNVIKEYEKYISINNTTSDSVMSRLSKYVSPKPKLKDIIEFFDMENFNFIQRDYFENTGLDFNLRPIYKKTHFYKIKNDVIYLDEIMCYLFDSIKPEKVFSF
jgi:serine/threonine protein kinase